MKAPAGCREYLRAPLQLHHDIVALDRDLDGLGDIRALHDRGARLDIDGIGFYAEAARIAVGLARADVELPAVPGAADDFPELRVLDLAGVAGLRQTDQRTLAKSRALMRAAIEQAE